MQHSNNLKGKVAVVTGSSGGLGRNICLLFAQAGADIALCATSKSESKLSEISKEIKLLGRRALPVACDVTRKNDVESMVGKVLDEFGKIDILVNTHGVVSTWGKGVMDTEEEDWDRDFAINLKGTYLCCQAAVQSMKARNTGVIVNFSSRAGINPSPNLGAYSVAKAGLVMLTRLMAVELGSHNIRVNAVAPGLIKTDMNIHLGWSDSDTAEKFAKNYVLGRLGETEDVGKMALFLASEDSSYITGQTILIDGGGLTPTPLQSNSN
ncbi:MAG: SDR family oxidoreductase [Proteobacteria bacterium]|nr:SDR family oxidoreductase [Pseudomonadota bacterium]